MAFNGPGSLPPEEDNLYSDEGDSFFVSEAELCCTHDDLPAVDFKISPDEIILKS